MSVVTVVSGARIWGGVLVTWVVFLRRHETLKGFGFSTVSFLCRGSFSPSAGYQTLPRSESPPFTVLVGRRRNPDHGTPKRVNNRPLTQTGRSDEERKPEWKEETSRYLPFDERKVTGLIFSLQKNLRRKRGTIVGEGGLGRCDAGFLFPIVLGLEIHTFPSLVQATPSTLSPVSRPHS